MKNIQRKAITFFESFIIGNPFWKRVFQTLEGIAAQALYDQDRVLWRTELTAAVVDTELELTVQRNNTFEYAPQILI